MGEPGTPKSHHGVQYACFHGLDDLGSPHDWGKPHILYHYISSIRVDHNVLNSGPDLHYDFWANQNTPSIAIKHGNGKSYIYRWFSDWNLHLLYFHVFRIAMVDYRAVFDQRQELFWPNWDEKKTHPCISSPSLRPLFMKSSNADQGCWRVAPDNQTWLDNPPLGGSSHEL